MKFLLFIVFGIAAQMVSASSYRQLTVDELITHSELIFEGKVTNLSYKIPTDRDQIYTFVTFEIKELLKGTYGQSTLELRYPGGQMGNQIDAVEDMVIPQPGQEGVYFVRSLTEHFIHPLTGWAQGQMLIVNQAGNRRLVSVEGNAIYSLTGPIARTKTEAPELNADVALGVVTGQQIEQALSVQAFKNQLKSLTEPK